MKSLLMLGLLIAPLVINSSNDVIEEEVSFQFKYLIEEPAFISSYDYLLHYTYNDTDFTSISVNATYSGLPYTIVLGSSRSNAFYLGSRDAQTKAFYGGLVNGWYCQPTNAYDSVYKLAEPPLIHTTNLDLDNSLLLTEEWFNNSIMYVPTAFNETYTFNFNTTINFNSLGNSTLENAYFLANSSWVNGYTWYHKEVLFTDTYFTSGGEVFTSIWCDIHSGYGTSYWTNSSIHRTWNDENYCYYGAMYYQNEITGKVVVVNTRIWRIYGGQEAGESGQALTNTSVFTSPSYQSLTFYEKPSEILITSLNRFNNSNYVPTDAIYTGDVGLGSAFALLTNAFTSLTGILSISVFPGITIGLLLFLPLIVFIIIAVFWFIKR